MEWLSENWVFLLIAVGFVAMHLFGHGAHGGYGGHGRDECDRREVPNKSTGTARRGHRH